MADYYSSHDPNQMMILGNKHNMFNGKMDKRMGDNDNRQKKDVLNLLKKMSSSSTSADSNDLPPKLEFKYSHTLNSTTIQKENVVMNTPTQPSILANKKVSPFAIYYKGISIIGGGLHNMGNTCFLNSVLQCLMYTQPFQNYLLHSDHLKKCRPTSVCFLCEMGNLIKALQERKSAQPYGIIRNIKLISKHLRIGRQEDAHEFLIFLLDSLEKSFNTFLKNTSKSFIIDRSSNSRTSSNLIQNIFGGELSSEVICLKCRHKSITTDRILTLSLEISNADTIERCLENFCKYEPLFGSNKYFCEYCNMKNDSKKRFMFKTLPNVLVIHLKRFDNYQRKIQKFIKYYNELDMKKFCIEGENEGDCRYKLVSVLIHNGYSADSGHYYSFLKGGDGKGWYEMNDSMVEKIAESYAMNQAPYMFFYQRVVKEKVDVNVKVKEKKNEPSAMVIDYKIVKEPEIPVVEKKVYWQNKRVNIEDISIIYENKRLKKMKNINKMIRKMRKNDYNEDEEEEKDNNISCSEHEDNTIDIQKPLTNQINQQEEEEEEKEDIYTQMKRNFDQNFHKIDRNYNEEDDGLPTTINHTKQLKPTKSYLIKSNDLQCLYNSNKISLWDNSDSDTPKPKGQNSILSNQIHFITKEAQNNFLNHKVKHKSEYDTKLDQGRKKKVKVDPSHRHRHKNYFQSLSDQQYKQQEYN